MTIGVSARARHMPFRGPDDVSMPSGMWVADVEVTGDASGGEMVLNVILTESAQADESFYSLEQFAYQTDQDSGLLSTFSAFNMRNYADPASPRSMTYNTGPGINGEAGRHGPLPRDTGGLTPLFLGQGPGVNVAAQLFIGLTTTNTLAVAFRTHLWGYRWGGQAMDTPTGPRRPLGSVFGE